MPVKAPVSIDSTKEGANKSSVRPNSSVADADFSTPPAGAMAHPPWLRINSNSARVVQREQVRAGSEAESTGARQKSMPHSAVQGTSIASHGKGLPTELRHGIESLSGFSMENVTVHYNSSRPAQVQAHAFAQGSEIHLGPGQEEHLPHEAWHVVQQAQGRVRPTMQMKGSISVNDDKSLELEADAMGKESLDTGKRVSRKNASATPGMGAQRQVNRSVAFQSAPGVLQAVWVRLGSGTSDVELIGDADIRFTEEMRKTPGKWTERKKWKVRNLVSTRQLVHEWLGDEADVPAPIRSLVEQAKLASETRDVTTTADISTEKKSAVPAAASSSSLIDYLDAADSDGKAVATKNASPSDLKSAAVSAASSTSSLDSVSFAYEAQTSGVKKPKKLADVVKNQNAERMFTISARNDSSQREVKKAEGHLSHSTAQFYIDGFYETCLIAITHPLCPPHVNDFTNSNRSFTWLDSLVSYVPYLPKDNPETRAEAIAFHPSSSSDGRPASAIDVHWKFVTEQLKEAEEGTKTLSLRQIGNIITHMMRAEELLKTGKKTQTIVANLGNKRKFTGFSENPDGENGRDSASP